MLSRWQIACYIDDAGCQPVVEYMFDNKNETDLSVMIAVIQRLSRVGLELVDTKMAKHIDGPIYELIKDRHRILFAEDAPKARFVLLSAFLKETQKTPPEEIEKAHSYWKNYLRTENCEVFKIPVEDF